MKSNKKTIPIQLLIATSMCVSILVASTFFLVMAYKRMSDHIISATQVTAKYVADTVNQSVKLTLTPCDVTIKMLHLSEIGNASTLEERLKFAPLFAEALKANPIGDAVYTGYATGEFMLMRRVSKDMGALNVSAPAEAQFLLQIKTLRRNGKFYWQFMFFDENMKLLETVPTSQLSLDPRERTWFKLAQENTQLIATRPYVFFDTKEIGISLAQRTPDGKAVVAIDATTADLSELLSTLRITPATVLVLTDDTREIVAYPAMHTLKHKSVGPDGAYALQSLDFPVLEDILEHSKLDGALSLFVSKGTRWFGLMTKLDSFYGNGLHLIVAIPATEMFKELQSDLIRQGLLAVGILSIILVVGWRFGRRMAQPLHRLAEQVTELSKFNFDAPIGIPTRVREVATLGDVLSNMAQAIIGFRNIARALNRERNLEKMIVSVLHELLGVVGLRDGAVYLYDAKINKLQLTATEGGRYLYKFTLDCDANEEVIELHGHTAAAFKKIHMLLRNRDNATVGLLCLICDADTPQEIHDRHSSLFKYIENVSSAIAVAIETRQLLHAQKALLDSLIKLVADAIDAKSIYTGGHCRRVPEFSLMLLEKVLAAKSPPLDTFSMSESEKEEFRIAAWLHDCGKITTAEYVVDKATKLETIYNRFHEIRTRFEVLHRDATIRYLNNLLQGMDPDAARQALDEELRALQDDYVFMAASNIGTEAMAQADVERLQRIGQRVWTRHFDNHLGLSRDELRRMESSHEPTELPVEEFLLADKHWHIVPWGKNIPPVQVGDVGNVLGFDMKRPEVMYNYGELYNLSIKYGTLTPEERFKINDHIVQTLCMLSTLPLPASMRKVPDIASNHHETLVGTGYPRRLNAEKLSTPERIIAIADIFEALTASDRPYKEGKTLKQALSILAQLARKRHIDGDLFNVMLHSGVFLDYAHKYLESFQLDITDVSQIAEYLYTPPAPEA